jgi:hypothetical protein
LCARDSSGIRGLRVFIFWNPTASRFLSLHAARNKKNQSPYRS